MDLGRGLLVGRESILVWCMLGLGVMKMFGLLTGGCLFCGLQVGLVTKNLNGVGVSENIFNIMIS